MHDKYEWPDNHRRPDEVLAAPSVISDVMDPVRSQGNGRIYDSKSEIRKHYRRDGFTEVGNDPARKRPKKREKIDGKAIAESVDKAIARFNRGERIKGKARANDGPYRAPI
jgi:hypothetical protein